MIAWLLACTAERPDPSDPSDPPDDPTPTEPAPTEPAPADTPVALHGRLSVDGLQLVDQQGAPVQLRGVSDQGIQWFPWGTCFDDASLDFLADADGMNVDMVRIPVYVTEGGWLRDPQQATDDAARLVDEAIARGLYVILDWHVTSFDPNDHLDEALAFWDLFAARYAGTPNLLFEIANEPSRCRWSDVKAYAEVVIPRIRAVDPDVPVLVGTPDDSASLGPVADAPLEGPLAHNVLYVYHLYAGSMDAGEIGPYLDRLPLFVSEWGAASYSGDAPDDYENAATFAALLDGPAQRVSWIGWSFTDDRETSAMLQRGTCGGRADAWTVEALTPSGTFFRDLLR